MSNIREISFIADVTEYNPAQGKDYTTKKRVTLIIDPASLGANEDRCQGIAFWDVQPCEDK